MAYDMRFTGVLTFASIDELDEATEEVEEIVDDADPDFLDVWDINAEEWFFEDERVLTVAVDTFGPADWWVTLESIVEIYAAYAASGVVDSWYDDEPRTSHGPDAPQF